MSLQATYNTVTLNPLLTWSETVSAVFASNGKAVTGYRHQFTLEGFFDNAGGNATSKQTDVNTILSKLRESGQDLTITQDSIDIRSFDAADCQGTGPWSTFDIPGTDNPLKVGFNVPFTLKVEGVTDPPTVTNNKTADTYTDTYAWDQQLRRTITRNGTLSTQSGTSAVAQFAGTDPVASLPSGSTWELTRKEHRVDDDDQNLTYAWVYEEQHETNPTSTKDLEYTISSTMQDGTEQWTASGSLSYELGTSLAISDVQTVLKNASAWPSRGLHVISESLVDDNRNGTLQFTIAAEKPFGAGGTYSYRESVTTTTVRATRDFHVFGGKGQDQRQELHRPDVVVVQEGEWVKDGSYPTEPNPVIAGDAVVEKEFVKDSVQYDPKGKARRYPLRWRITMRPLNVTPPGQFRRPVDPTQNNPLTGGSASRVAS